MVPNVKGNLVKLLRNKLTGEARRCIIGNYYNNLEDFISKLKTFFPIKYCIRIARRSSR